MKKLRAFTTIELVSTLVVLGILTTLGFLVLLGGAHKLQSNIGLGNQEAVITAEMSYAQSNGSYTYQPSLLTGIPRSISVVTTTATTQGQVSIAVDASTGQLGLASVNATGVCSGQLVDTIANGGNRTSVTPSGACSGANALAGTAASSSSSTPTGVTAVAGAASATVSWSAPSGGGVTGYTVTSSPGSFTCTTAGATSCTVTGLTNGTSYTFTVVATTIAGPSAASSPSNAVTPGSVPDPPTNVTGVAGNSQVAISWTAPASNGGSSITGYTVSAFVPGGQSASGSCSTTGATTCTVTGLTNGTGYTFSVTATNSMGTSASSTPSSLITPCTTPSVPTSLSSSVQINQVTVNFKAPTSTGGAAVSSYTVTDQLGNTCTISADGTSVSCSNASYDSCSLASSTYSCAMYAPLNATLYTYSVYATNSAGNSTAATTSATTFTVPGAPTGVSATASSALLGSATISWTAPASNGGTAITGYTVTSSPGGYTCITTGYTSCNIYTLSYNTSYTFTVTATNGEGTGPSSSASAAVTTPTNQLNAGQSIWSSPGTGQFNALFDTSGAYELVMQGDGNLVLYQIYLSVPLWSTAQHSGGPFRLAMQTDCNLVIYNNGGTAVWNSGTNGKGSSCRLVMQSDANLVIYSGATAVWSTGT